MNKSSPLDHFPLIKNEPEMSDVIQLNLSVLWNVTTSTYINITLKLCCEGKGPEKEMQLKDLLLKYREMNLKDQPNMKFQLLSTHLCADGTPAEFSLSKRNIFGSLHQKKKPNNIDTCYAGTIFYF